MQQQGIEQSIQSANKVHFIGIGGISMSALALILRSRGYEVSGSDMNTDSFRKLEEAGVTVFHGHHPDNIQDADLVIYTAAIRADNPELTAARARGVQCYERKDLLGALMRQFSCPIGIAGTHGKSTTTSMLSCIMLDAGLDPTITVGANLPQIQSNFHLGTQKYFIFESDEYAASFLKFYPKISIILNIDEDHLDFYKDMHEITATFEKYILENTAKDGIVIINQDDANCRKVVEKFQGQVVTFGLYKGDYHASNIHYRNGFASFDLIYKNKKLCGIALQVPGEHNIRNAVAAAACAHTLKVGLQNVISGLHQFRGAQRRFEIKGRTELFTVVDDYAHHPSEIEATLKAARNMDYDKIILIFQPHTYSRTKALMPKFRQALSLADNVILCDIYAARELEDKEVSSRLLASQIEGAVYASSFAEAARAAKEAAVPNSLILTMGAGDVYKTAELLLEEDERVATFPN